MTDLKEKKCIPCEAGGVDPLSREEAERLLTEVEDWKLNEKATGIYKDFTFKDFVKAMDFVSMVADRAEQEGHHPDIHISYNKVHLELSTHAIGGLSENDFIVAAKINQIRL